MIRRVVVSPECPRRCPSCSVCAPGAAPDLASVLVHDDAPTLRLGGGDATAWPHLWELLDANRRRFEPLRVWVEAPAAALSAQVLSRLAAAGATGVSVFAEALGERMAARLGVGEPVAAVARAQAVGLSVDVIAAVRPSTFAIVAPLAARVAPTPVWLEITRQDERTEPGPIPADAIEALLGRCDNLQLSGWRMPHRGYLPPCAVPRAWELRRGAWSSTLRDRDTPNDVLPACAACALATRCHFRDPGALDVEPTPVLVDAAPPQRLRHRPVPAAIIARRTAPPVVCTTPWTTLQVVDPIGEVHQCCTEWTIGARAMLDGESLLDVWNGPGYREARRVMGAGTLETLCRPICPRLYDHAWSEKALRIQDGSPRFVENQLLLAEDIAERREEVRGLPTRLAFAPSTYCNYDCIMCDYGRTPRRELSATIWDDVERLLPTLENITLLGGEPLASPDTIRFLQSFDATRTPDPVVNLVTNGSLLTERLLARMTKCSLGDVTISVNAGTPEVYEQVQRGVALEELLRNVDALLRFRESHFRPFGVTLSFVVQPTAAHTLIPFGELARARGLRIRLLPLHDGPRTEPHLAPSFYRDPDAVARIVEHLDAFIAWATHDGQWVREARAVRAAILAKSLTGGPRGGRATASGV